MKAQLGHDGPPRWPWRENLINEQPLAECPLRTLLRAREETPDLSAELDRYVDTYYPAYRDGHLLVKGGISDQPARYLDIVIAMRATEAAVNRKEAAQQRRQDQEAAD
jgi:hypothetical protein